MTTMGDRIVAFAESQVGVREDPLGSNTGGCEKYQKLYGDWYVGKAWCGCFVGWVWTSVNRSWKQLASPSTAVMCDIANARGLVIPPQPGAAFVICGVHTGIITDYIGQGIWRTVEGNSGDAVNIRQRSLAGLTIYGPPGLAKEYTPTKPPVKRNYWIEDPRQIRYYGGWGSAAVRDHQQRILEARLGKKLRKFKDPKRSAPYMLEDVSVKQYYGPWSTKEARDSAGVTLRKRLGRLRYFSTEATATTVAVVDDLGKVD